MCCKNDQSEMIEPGQVCGPMQVVDLYYVDPASHPSEVAKLSVSINWLGWNKSGSATFAGW